MGRLTPRGRPGESGSDPHWVKSSLSFANGNCVEVADLPDGQIGVRDSKDTAGPILRFTSDEWHAFLGGARNGEFDRFGKRQPLRAGCRGILHRLTVDQNSGEGLSVPGRGLRLSCAA